MFIIYREGFFHDGCWPIKNGHLPEQAGTTWRGYGSRLKVRGPRVFYKCFMLATGQLVRHRCEWFRLTDVDRLHFVAIHGKIHCPTENLHSFLQGLEKKHVQVIDLRSSGWNKIGRLARHMATGSVPYWSQHVWFSHDVDPSGLSLWNGDA